MSDKEHYFTIKEAAKLLGVSATSIKRRIKSKKINAQERLGKRGLELVIPQRALNLEIMSLIPSSRTLNLSDFETIVMRRYEAMAAGRDQRVSHALKELRKEFMQLTAELHAFNSSAGEDVLSRVENEKQSSQRGGHEQPRS
jgi:excisionase family DNA binding protein